jgi:hypothetical protein
MLPMRRIATPPGERAAAAVEQQPVRNVEMTCRIRIVPLNH